MRLLTILRARAHLRLSHWHERRAWAIIDALKAPRSSQPLAPTEHLLLARIVGTAIAGVWLGMTWRAMQ